MSHDPDFVASGRCKHFVDCRGRCKPEHPQHGKWWAPAEVPERLSKSYDVRSAPTCPSRLLDGQERQLMGLWADWSFYGKTGPALPGTVASQPPWITQGLAVLSDEQAIIVEAKAERDRKLREMSK